MDVSVTLGTLKLAVTVCVAAAVVLPLCVFPLKLQVRWLPASALVTVALSSTFSSSAHALRSVHVMLTAGRTVTVKVFGSPVSVPLAVWYFGVTENSTTCVVLVVLVVLVSVAVRLPVVVPEAARPVTSEVLLRDHS